MRLCVIVVAALALQGCGLIAVSCTDELRYAVQLTVRDQSTGGRLSSVPVGTLTDGAYRETMEVYELDLGHEVAGGGFRAGGPYDIEVRAAGYRTWTLDNVAVDMNRRCDKPADTFRRAVEMHPLES